MPATSPHPTITLVTTSPISLDRDEQLFVAPRPLPGRRIGRATLTGGTVYAVPASDADRAVELAGQSLTALTGPELDQLRVDTIRAAGFDPADHTADEIVNSAAELGLRLTRIDPTTSC